MNKFTVVDLGSQAKAVADHVKGWSKLAFLTWLSQFGEVIQVHDPSGNDRYSFRSHAGVWSGFWFDTSGNLQLLEAVGSAQQSITVPMYIEKSISLKEEDSPLDI